MSPGFEAVGLLDIGTIFRQMAMTADGKIGISFIRERSEPRHFSRLKSYPDGSWELMVCSSDVFRDGGCDPVDKPVHKQNVSNKRDTSGERSEAEAERSEPEAERGKPDVERARRRAASAVRDLALCNDFRWFATLTLDQQRIDRYDMSAIMRKVNSWLDNAVRRQGLRYVLVPELHKDGAVHFHGFFSDSLAAVDSGHKDSGGHAVFNLPQWKFGFTAAIELYGSYHSAVGYVCKYVRKQSAKIGGRWYYSGGSLRKPDVSYGDVTLRDVAGRGGYTFCVPGAQFVILRGGGENDERGMGDCAPQN